MNRYGVEEDKANMVFWVVDLEASKDAKVRSYNEINEARSEAMRLNLEECGR